MTINDKKKACPFEQAFSPLKTSVMTTRFILNVFDPYIYLTYSMIGASQSVSTLAMIALWKNAYSILLLKPSISV